MSSRARIKNDDGSTRGLTWALGYGLAAVALTLALGSFNSNDPSFSTFSSKWAAPKNVLGYIGSWTSDSLFQVLGFSAWALPMLMFVGLLRWLFLAPRPKEILPARFWIGLGLLLVGLGTGLDLLAPKIPNLSFMPQGLLGMATSALLQPIFGRVGTYLLVAALVWAFCLVWWDELPSHCVRIASKPFLWGAPIVQSACTRLAAAPRKLYIDLHQRWLARRDLKIRGQESLQQSASPMSEPKIHVEGAPDSAPITSRSIPVRDAGLEQSAETSSERKSKFAKPATPRPAHWSLPPINLLEPAKKRFKELSKAALQNTALKIEDALKSFEIEGHITEITPGPIITMYEFQPGPGVRVQKLMSASTDLAMTLGAPAVRIVAPIPGKSVAGIEVPNLDKEDIVLRDVFELTIDKARSQRLPLVLGKDSEGKPICEDLSRMPHLLIGGATSMGKSVLVNSILTSLLCRFSPDDLRLIIVDPKLVEFKIFEDIPHLLLPIVNETKDASQALKWAVAETKRRYLLMQKLAAKNIDGYNAKSPEEKLPYIVIIIDELAELMMTAKKDVEQSIVRLTQLARAAGLHLIMATQRPSADVVTGLIKSNCPSRAALRVASNADSRIILDTQGAEQLLGRGDMFFTSAGPMGLRRMQSCFVSDSEIERVANHWRAQGEPEYREEILAERNEDGSMHTQESSTDVDELYDQVLEFARDKGKISTSLIQRHFSIGYTRAARIMEQLEGRGVVGEPQAAGKPRDVIL
jgi:S-DNA-T family DNA segregation ATPase FtsK/SpoIIIE